MGVESSVFKPPTQQQMERKMEKILLRMEEKINKIRTQQQEMLQEMKTIEDQIDKTQMEVEEKTRKASIAEILLVTEKLLMILEYN